MMNTSLEDTLVLHVGYPKTATTSLQEILFCGHPQINNIGKPNFYSVKLKEAFQILKWSDEDEYIKKKNDIIEAFCSIGLEEGKLNVFSTEEIMGTNKQKCSREEYSNNLRRTIKRLHEVTEPSFKEIKVIIGIRKQDDIVISRYAQAVKQGIINPKKRPLSQIVNIGIIEPTIGVFSTQFYSKFINEFASCFGEEMLHIFVFEKLRENLKNSIEDLADFLKIDRESALKLMQSKKKNVKKKSDDAYLTTRTFYDRLLDLKFKYFNFFKVPKKIKSLIKNLLALKNEKPFKISLSSIERKNIMDIYRSDNNSLSKKYNLNLDRYGYF